jgi:DNA-binding NarL/FixJ family response regulator
MNHWMKSCCENIEWFMEMGQLKALLDEISGLKAALDEHAIVVIAGSQGKRDAAETYRLGVNGCVVKPVNFKDIDAAVRELGMFWLAHNPLPKMWSEI